MFSSRVYCVPTIVFNRFLTVFSVVQNVDEDKRNSELSGYVVQYTGNGEANSHYVGTADTLHTIIKWVMHRC